MIQVQDLTKEYDGNPVVDCLSFNVKEGQTLVLLGTSGSGKSTTLKMINRLIAPSSGFIRINDQDILDSKPEELRRNMGYVIQHIGLFPHLSIWENIAVVPRLLHWNSTRIKDRVPYLINMVGLGEINPGTYPNELSGGQQQRVGLARALAVDPDIVLMDEPFGALDPITRLELRREFRSLEETIRKTIILVTHDIVEAWELGDQICILDGGKLQQAGSPRDLAWQPANSFVSSFLQSHLMQLQMMTVKMEEVIKLLPGLDVKSMDQSLLSSIQEREIAGDFEQADLLHKAFLEYRKSKSRNVN